MPDGDVDSAGAVLGRVVEKNVDDPCGRVRAADRERVAGLVDHRGAACLVSQGEVVDDRVDVDHSGVDGHRVRAASLGTDEALQAPELAAHHGHHRDAALRVEGVGVAQQLAGGADAGEGRGHLVHPGALETLGLTCAEKVGVDLVGRLRLRRAHTAVDAYATVQEARSGHQRGDDDDGGEEDPEEGAVGVEGDPGALEDGDEKALDADEDGGRGCVRGG